MSVRDFLRHNRWQKLFSFLLAVLIWLTVRKGIERGSGGASADGSQPRAFEHVPVRVLVPPGTESHYTVSPPDVTVVLVGDPATLGQLAHGQVEAYVPLQNDNENTPGLRRVRVNVPGAAVLVVRPEEVLIRRLPPADKSPGAN